MIDSIKLILKGFCMGLAEAIPGVSGGTIAFITGIYRELIETIRSLSPSNLRLIFSDRKLFWQRINGSFIIRLLVGMGAGLIFGVLVLTHFLETEQEILWAFFFGLVIASAVYLGRKIKWSVYEILCLVGGALLTWWISGLVPTTGSDSLPYVLIAGVVSVSALMLPGVSGSFMLVLFGLYHSIIFAVKDLVRVNTSVEQLLFLGTFALGMLIGLFSFARVLSFLFKKYPQSTMAALTGVLIGSLVKIWPWKVITSIMEKSSGVITNYDDVRLPAGDLFKILAEQNVLPSNYASYSDPKTFAVIVSMIGGAALVAILSRFESDDMV